MNHQEMVDEVSDALRNVSIQPKITRWLNMSITYIGMRYIFEHLQKYASVNTATGVPDITLEDDFQWLKNIQIPGDQRPLDPEDETRLAATFPDYRTLQGQVTCYYLSGPRKLGLFHVPSGIKNITYCYQARGLKLEGVDLVAEASDLPEEFHLVITKRAEIFGWQYEGDPEAKAVAVAEERRLIRDLGLTRYKRIDQRLVVGSNISSRYKPPYPKLPSSYPRGG